MLDLEEKYIPIVLCAGFGTRLKPLTNYIPKVVCPLIDKPFAFYNIEKFFKFGFSTVHCNTHYLPDIVKNEIMSACNFFGYNPNRVRFWNEDNILETGGGIARIYKELCQENPSNRKKDLLVVSGDIVADFPLEDMVSTWEQRQESEQALMCTKNLKTPQKDATYICNNQNHILGFGENFFLQSKLENITAKNFTNHQIISGSIVVNSNLEKKSSIDLFYRPILNTGKKIINLNYDESLYWFNIGHPIDYLEAIEFFSHNEKNCINYAFDMPEKLGILIKDRPLKNYTSENKIILSFRNNEHKLKNLLSLNELCSWNEGEDKIYLKI